MFKTFSIGVQSTKKQILNTPDEKYELLELNGAGKPMQMRFCLRLSTIGFALLFGTSTYPQNKTDEIDKLFSRATPVIPGCVCAISQMGKGVVNKAYGLADLEGDVLLNTNSIFDAGSVRKQFVAAAILLLVEEGKLSLSDDIGKYIPQLPDYRYKITIDHLLTHTSGIRDWQPGQRREGNGFRL